MGRLALVHGDDASGRVPDPADDLAARIDDERAMAALLDRVDWRQRIVTIEGGMH